MSQNQTSLLYPSPPHFLWSWEIHFLALSLQMPKVQPIFQPLLSEKKEKEIETNNGSAWPNHGINGYDLDIPWVSSLIPNFLSLHTKTKSLCLQGGNKLSSWGKHNCFYCILNGFMEQYSHGDPRQKSFQVIMRLFLYRWRCIFDSLPWILVWLYPIPFILFWCSQECYLKSLSLSTDLCWINLSAYLLSLEERKFPYSPFKGRHGPLWKVHTLNKPGLQASALRYWQQRSPVQSTDYWKTFSSKSSIFSSHHRARVYSKVSPSTKFCHLTPEGHKDYP